MKELGGEETKGKKNNENDKMQNSLMWSTEPAQNLPKNDFAPRDFKSLIR